jgi:arabinofuranan 3-O-arabinosyltransferase
VPRTPDATPVGRARSGVRAGRRERALLVVLAVLVVVVTLVQDWGVLTPDTKPELFLDSWETMLHTGSAWQDSPYLGAPNFNVGLAPVAAAFGVLQGFGAAPWLAMRIWRILLVLLAAAGARRFATRTAGVGPAGRVAAAVLYAANPYLLLGGATTPTLLPYALLPWFLLALRAGFARPRSLYWPCVAGLLFTAMSGINAGVVPILQTVGVVALVVEARLRLGRPWRSILRVLAVTAVPVALAALYWLVPAVSALGVGAAIAGSTETLDVIAAPSSAAEVVRGLGFWTLYGADGTGPFMPGIVAYVTSPVVVVASFAWPLLAAAGALVSRSPARLLGVTLVAVSVPVMVGTHPGLGGVSPLGRALTWAFENVPGAVAFRTTNKAGAVLMLGFALLGSLAVHTAWEAVRAAREHRTTSSAAGPRGLAGAGPAATGVAAAVVIVLGTLPVWTGGWFYTGVATPDYWLDAARALDLSDPVPDAGGSRVLLVPGATLSRYRWGYQGPDELGNSLFSRPTTYRSAVPAGTTFAANLLAGVDQPLQDGTIDPGALSALARYIGAGDVLVRNDTVWEAAAGARPSVVASATESDPGLRPAGEYGTPGRNTTSALDGETAAGAADAALPPLQRFAVDAPRGPVGQVAAAGSVLLDGDGAALPGLARRGVLDGTPALLLAGALADSEIRGALENGTRVVLSDTNGRRVINPQRLSGGTGPLLAATAAADPTLALAGTQDQTVLAPVDDTRVVADGRGLLFGPVPYGDVRLATDGDPTTSWLTGNFGSGVGEAVVLRRAGERPVPRVRIVLPGGGGPRVSAVRVVVTGAGPAVSRSVALPAPPARAVEVDLAAARGDRVRVEITGVTTPGIGPVGLAEVEVPGWAARTTARTPVRLSGLLSRIAAAGGSAAAALDRTPVDVQLARRRGPAAGQDEEPAMSRDVTLPLPRTYRLAARVRFADGVADTVLDAWDPRRLRAAATASSRAARDLGARASSAVDADARGRADLATAWVPDDPVVGQWLQVATAAQRLDRLTVTQPADGGGLAVRARLDVDGEPVTEVALGPGTVTVPLGGRTASRVRLTLLARAGDGPVRISDLTLHEAAAARGVVRPEATAAPSGCLTVATVDGEPLRVRATRPATAAARLLAGGPVAVEACDRRPLALAAGTRRVRPVPGLALDTLDLVDTLAARSSSEGAVEGAVAASLRPAATVLAVGDTARRLRTVATGAPYYVVAGTGYDPGWRAAADGVDLGPPVLVDGYSTGWLVADGAAHDVRMRYGPVRRAAVAGAVSAAAVLACLVVVGREIRARRPSTRGRR